MEQVAKPNPHVPVSPTTGTWAPGRFLTALGGLAVTLVLLWVGFDFLRNSTATDLGTQLFSAGVAILWGVGGVALLYTVSNMLVESFNDTWRSRIQPYIFVGPAIFMLSWFLFIPVLRTFYQSLFYADAQDPNVTDIGIQNYVDVFTKSDMLESFRNNIIWLVLGTLACVVLGLLIAVLADRSRFESLAKAIIFMPMAISFVGAGIIWRFIYAVLPVERQQIGLLNAINVSLGGQPQNWITQEPWNTLFLIVVLIWMQTGFAMVIFSAALKGVPADLLEAARVDGATEIQSFFRIIIPYIQTTIITVTTTIAIFTLKIFDVVRVMTGGKYGTSVVATQYFDQYFQYRNFGNGAAIAIVLLIAVLPVMIYNLRQVGKQEGF